MLHSNRSRSPYEDGTKPMTVQMAAGSPDTGGALGYHRLAITNPAPSLSPTR